MWIDRLSAAIYSVWVVMYTRRTSAYRAETSTQDRTGTLLARRAAWFQLGGSAVIKHHCSTLV